MDTVEFLKEVKKVIIDKINNREITFPLINQVIPIVKDDIKKLCKENNNFCRIELIGYDIYAISENNDKILICEIN